MLLRISIPTEATGKWCRIHGMSLFIDSQSIAPQNVSQQRLELASFQYDGLNGLLTTIRKSCGQKCIPLDYGENDLSKGESECTNRCVSKFMQAHKIIGNYVESNGRLKDSDMVVYQSVKKGDYTNKFRHE